MGRAKRLNENKAHTMSSTIHLSFNPGKPGALFGPVGLATYGVSFCPNNGRLVFGGTSSQLVYLTQRRRYLTARELGESMVKLVRIQPPPVQTPDSKMRAAGTEKHLRQARADDTEGTCLNPGQCSGPLADALVYIQPLPMAGRKARRETNRRVPQASEHHQTLDTKSGDRRRDMPTPRW
jgi:hypothetical protein